MLIVHEADREIHELRRKPRPNNRARIHEFNVVKYHILTAGLYSSILLILFYVTTKSFMMRLMMRNVPMVRKAMRLMIIRMATTSILLILMWLSS